MPDQQQKALAFCCRPGIRTPIPPSRGACPTIRRAGNDLKITEIRCLVNYFYVLLSKYMKNFIWIGGLIIILIAFMTLGVKGSVAIDPPFEVGVIHPLDNVKGNPDAKVVVMEYSDFQCPACRSYYPITKQLMAEFDNEVAFVYRNFPLTSIHLNAEFASRAAEAAGKQSKFWEMHNLLFEKQSEWERSNDILNLFSGYATLLGISVDQFKIDWSSKEIKDLVKAQKAHAIKAGIGGTPTFFINGKQIQNPRTFDEFKAIIQNAINNQE